jgi:hypothetical protein
MLALLPNLNAEPLKTALFEVVNDEHLVLYIASLVRSVTSLHDLVINKQKLPTIPDSTTDNKVLTQTAVAKH